jgi:hypothetical protein
MSVSQLNVETCVLYYRGFLFVQQRRKDMNGEGKVSSDVGSERRESDSIGIDLLENMSLQSGLLLLNQ